MAASRADTPTRERLLEAARIVLARDGLAGVTTRGIAEEAGVNEVTLFRHFGSKAALMHEALGAHALGLAHPLPEWPEHPEAELTAWAVREMERLRHGGQLLRQCVAGVPAGVLPTPCGDPLVDAVAKVQRDLDRVLRAYFGHLAEQLPAAARAAADVDAAVSMMRASLVTDAVNDELAVLGATPLPDGPRRYARAALRILGWPLDTGAASGGASDLSTKRTA